MTLQLQGINKSFGASPALKDIQLTLTKGKFTTLLGPSGCGKTTLLRIIAGLESPDHGEIHLGDVCLFSKNRRINRPVHQRDFGMVFQDFALWPHLTVLENVAFGLKAKATQPIGVNVQWKLLIWFNCSEWRSDIPINFQAVSNSESRLLGLLWSVHSLSYSMSP